MALQEASALLKRNASNLWAKYLCILCLGFKNEIASFSSAVEALNELEAKNVFFRYLIAYNFLLRQNTEKALWHYLEIVDEKEGWLARTLIKKLKTDKTLEHIEGRLADFIVLPEFLPPRQAQSSQTILTPAAKTSKPIRSIWIKYSILSISILAFFIGLYFLSRHLKLSPQSEIKFPDARLGEWAAVMPVKNEKSVIYRYANRDAIITDFELAKQFLKTKRVNQSRYLLQRMILSNADFQSREKARYFTGFIPDLEFSDFADNIDLQKLLKEPKLRMDSLIVCDGELRDTKEEKVDEKIARTYRLISASEENELKLVVYASPSVVEEKTDQDFSTHRKRKKNTLQVYGKFKGLIGDQRAIYLEAIRVWR